MKERLQNSLRLNYIFSKKKCEINKIGAIKITIFKHVCKFSEKAIVLKFQSLLFNNFMF